MLLISFLVVIMLLVAASGYGYSRRADYGHYGYSVGSVLVVILIIVMFLTVLR